MQCTRGLHRLVVPNSGGHWVVGEIGCNLVMIQRDELWFRVILQLDNNLKSLSIILKEPLRDLTVVFFELR